MKTCDRCGKLLHPDSIHTCSPQVAEDFPDARLPDVPAPSGWLTRPPHEAPWQADDQEAWFGEAKAQRDRAVAAEAMVAGRDNQMAALRQLAEEAVAEIENVERGWHEHAKAHDPEWCSHYEPGGTLTALRSQLAEIVGAS